LGPGIADTGTGKTTLPENKEKGKNGSFHHFFRQIMLHYRYFFTTVHFIRTAGHACTNGNAPLVAVLRSSS
jgi:hypothetical protein